MSTKTCVTGNNFILHKALQTSESDAGISQRPIGLSSGPAQTGDCNWKDGWNLEGGGGPWVARLTYRVQRLGFTVVIVFDVIYV